MAYKDLREFIDALEKNGELQRIKKEVDWHLEIGAITRRCNEIGAPAPLAEKIKDYPEGYAILGSPLGGSKKKGKKMPFRRIAIALEMDADSMYQDIVEEYLQRTSTPIKPILVSEGPCQEFVLMGDEVDVLKFPVPMIHEGDGGRYMWTWHAVITKDPDSEWVNWGLYRGMVHTRNKLGGFIIPIQHIGIMYYQKYEAKNQPMPFATAIGGDPTIPFVACGYLAAGVNEVDIAGALRRQPVELVRCKTNDLLVPAHAEIVLEGEVLPHIRWEEGPFGEYTGFRAGVRHPKPVYKVNCITYRNNPILTMSCMGMPVDDSASTSSIFCGAELTKIFRDNGIPVRGVYFPPEGSPSACIISARMPVANYAHVLASHVWASKPGNFVHQIIIVDDDTDPTDMDKVFHDFVYKCHPDRGIMKYPKTTGSPLDPFLNYHERKHSLSAAVLIDTTWPKEWGPVTWTVESSFRCIYPKEIQDKVMERWEDYYGFSLEQ